MSMTSNQFNDAYRWLDDFVCFLVRRVSPLLAAAIQDMLNEVRQLRAERKELKKEIEDLKRAVALYELLESENHVIIRTGGVVVGE